MKCRPWTGALVAVAFASCGGSGGNGLNPSEKVIDLTPSEYTRLCEDVPHPAGLNNGQVKCPTGGYAPDPNNPTICLGATPMPNCVATVDDFNQCSASLAAHPCDNSALSTSGCLMSQICYNGFCFGACSTCTIGSSLDTCQAACATFTMNFTRECATCLAGLYESQICPDFTGLPSPYAQCASLCSLPVDAGGGAG